MQIIPLSTLPNHSFVATISVNGRNITLSFFLSYNDTAGYWTMRVKDPSTGTIILDSIPLLTDATPAANLLAQYEYMRIGSAYLIKVAPADSDYPNDENLGTLFVLAWGDNTIEYPASSVAEAISLVESLSATGVPYGIVQLEGKQGPPGLRGPIGPYNEIDVADAQAAQAAAEAARDASEAWALLAEQWATNPEDDPVENSPPLYSAFHWAQKAEDDAIATAADRVQTGLDVIQTGEDAVATAADRVQTGLDAIATGADRVQTGLDVIATAADRVQTGLDVVATAADRVQTGLDVVATGADVVQTAADRVQTGLDVTAATSAKNDAVIAQGLAEDAQAGAESAAADALASESKAEQWATNPEDTPVETDPNRYSSYHWAQKAEEIVATLTDPLVYKGAIDCSSSPNYPAADAGHVYKVSVAGKIGGASGVIVQVGDTLICSVDDSASGDQAAVGANWHVLQANIVSLDDLILASAESDFIVSGPSPFAWAKKTLADVKSLLHGDPGTIGGTTPDAGTFTTGTIAKQLWTSATELTIASGAITAIKSLHTVDTQSDDATDDLDTINGGSDGQFLAIRAIHTDRTVVIKHNTGNIFTGGSDISLDDTTKYVLFLYDSALSKWVVAGGSGSGGGTSIIDTVTQAGHGFSVGNVIYRASGSYAKAKADAAPTAEAVGVVSEVAGDVFKVVLGGKITGLSGLTDGSVYFVSEDTAGLLTTTEPTIEGSISKPVLIATSATTGLVFNMRGAEITDPTTSYFMAFTNASLAAGVLTVTHNLGHKYVTVQVYDNNEKLVVPDEVTLSSTTALAIDLTSYGTISGTWHVVVLDIGTTAAQSNTYDHIEEVTAGHGVVIDGLAIKDGGITTQLGLRNAIINGGMDIWQRGTSTLTNPANGTYFPDRFSVLRTSGDAVYNLEQSAETPSVNFPFQYSLKLDCTTAEAAVAAGELCAFRYILEGYDFTRFEGNIATLSFWVKAVKTGIYCVSFRNRATPDKSYVVEYTINSASTWEKKTVTLTFNSGGTFLYTTGQGLQISWALFCGSTFQTTPDAWQSGNYLATSNQVNGMDSTDNNFWLTGVQLELGSVATPFEVRPFAQELALCQRYLPSYALAAAGRLPAIGNATANNTGFVTITFPGPSRTPPTGITYSSLSHIAVECDGVVADTVLSALTFSMAGRDAARLQWTVATTPFTAGQIVALRGADTGQLYFTGCEL